jgi:hypothetical protein
MCAKKNYKPKGKKKIDEINLSSFNSNSSLDLNSSNRPSEKNDKVEVSPKKIHLGKKEKPPWNISLNAPKQL